MIVALEPLVPLLTNESCIVARFQRALVIDHSKQRVPATQIIPPSVSSFSPKQTKQKFFIIIKNHKHTPVVTEGSVFPVLPGQSIGRAVVVSVSPMRHEWRHVELLRERDERRDLFILDARVLEALEMEARHDGQLFHRQLLRTFLIRLAVAALYLGRGAEVLRSCESLQAVEE